MQSRESSVFEGTGWRRAARHPVLVLLLLVAVQTLPTLASRDYWAFDEVRHADALRELRQHGHGLSLHLNGRPYPDKPPVYFWLAALAADVTGTDAPPAFFLVSALGGFLFLLATWALARETIARDRPGLALAAPLLVTITPLFQLLLRTTRMDLLFGALIAFAYVALWRGTRTRDRSGWVVLGLGLAGLAALVKGPVGLAFPLVTLLVHLLATGRARRLAGWDVLAGLALAFGLVGAWAVALGLTEGWGYLRDLLSGQVVGRALVAHKHSQGVWFYLAALPGAWLPWTALLATVPWRTVASPRAWRAAWARGREEPRGGLFLAVAFATGFVLLSVASSKLFIYLLPLFAPLAIGTVAWLDGLDARATRRFWTIVGASLLVGAVTLPFANRWQPFAEVTIRGLLPTAALLAATGLGVLLSPRRALTVSVAGLTLAFLVIAFGIAPSFDPVMSPRRQAEALAAFADRGHAPLVFRVYPGTYSYYAGRAVPETRDENELALHLGTHDRVVVATSRSNWEKYGALFEGLALVQEQRIEGKRFVLLVRPPPPRGPNRDE